MEAIRIHKVITDEEIDRVRQFVGRKVEIIILAEEEPIETAEKKTHSFAALRGSCPDIIDGMEFQEKMREDWVK